MATRQLSAAVWQSMMEDGRKAFLDGHYNLAAVLCQAALDMAIDAGDVLSEKVGNLLMLIGDLRCELFDYATAEAVYWRAALVFANVFGPSHIDVCIALKRISELCRAQGKLAEAVFVQQESDKLLSAKQKGLEACLSGEAIIR